MNERIRLYTGPGERDYYEFAAGEQPTEIATRQMTGNSFALGTLPNPDPILRRMGKAVEVYRDIMVDARVGSNLENRAGGVLSKEHEVDQGQASARVAKEVTTLIDDLPVHKITEEMLLAPWYGYQPVEILWRQVGRYVVPREIQSKPPEWFSFDDANHLRLRTRSNPLGLDLEDPEYRYKFLCPSYRATYQNPYGTPVAARCFWPAAFKKGGWKFWVTLCEKFGVPYLMGKYRQGADKAEREELLSSLQRMIQDACAVIPEGNAIEALEFTGKGDHGSLHKGLIDAANGEIATAILGHTGTSQSTPGRLGSEDSALEVRDDIVRADQEIVEAAWNTIVRWVVEINWGNVPAPRFRFYDEEQVDTALAERDKTLHEQGVRFSAQYYIEAYNLPEGQFEVTSQASAATPTQFAAPPAAAVAGDGPGQDAVDRLIDGLPDALLQRQAEAALAPLIEFVNGATSLEDIQLRAAELFPDLDTRDLEQTIERAVFAAEAWGRVQPTEE
jgi:phage gp29-like protein